MNHISDSEKHIFGVNENALIQTNKPKTAKFSFALSPLWPSLQWLILAVLCFSSWKQKHVPDLELASEDTIVMSQLKKQEGNYQTFCYCSAISWQLVDSKSAKKKKTPPLAQHMLSWVFPFLRIRMRGHSTHTHTVSRMYLWQWSLLMLELNNQILSRHPSSDGGGGMHAQHFKSTRRPTPRRHFTDTCVKMIMKDTVQLQNCVCVSLKNKNQSSFYQDVFTIIKR